MTRAGPAGHVWRRWRGQREPEAQPIRITATSTSETSSPGSSSHPDDRPGDDVGQRPGDEHQGQATAVCPAASSGTAHRGRDHVIHRFVGDGEAGVPSTPAETVAAPPPEQPLELSRARRQKPLRGERPPSSEPPAQSHAKQLITHFPDDGRLIATRIFHAPSAEYETGRRRAQDTRNCAVQCDVTSGRMWTGK